MCLGVPLQVRSMLPNGVARCRAHDDQVQERSIHVSLLDAPPSVGDWLLVHVDVAIRPLDAGEARQIRDALLAVDAAVNGQAFEHLLADLIDREPQLPDHLKTPTGGC